MPNETGDAETELTVTVLPHFHVPELDAGNDFSSYDDAINVAAVTLGNGAIFTVERTNEVIAVEALIPDGTPLAAPAPAPYINPPADTEAPTDDSTGLPVAPDAPTDELPAPVPSGDSSAPADPDTNADVVDDTAGSTGDVPAPADAGGADGSGAPEAEPVDVTGDATDPDQAPAATVADVPTDAGDVVLGSPQVDQADDTPPTPDGGSGSDIPTPGFDTTVVTPTLLPSPPVADTSTPTDGGPIADPAPWVDPAPIDTTNSVLDVSTPAVPPTDTPADATPSTEITPPTDQ